MKLRFKILPLLAIFALTGCEKQAPEELLIQAQKKLKSNEVSSAIIDLKNVLQNAPENANARFLLGQSYLKKGAAASAEKELLQALRLGVDENKVKPLLAKSFSLQFKNQEVIDLANESENLKPIAETALLLYQAVAYFQIDRPHSAKKSIRKANEISADSVYSLLGNAYLAFSNRELNHSLQLTNKILKSNPTLDEAFLLKAQLESAKNEPSKAVESFEKYRDLVPEILQSQIFLANAYIKDKQFEKAERLIDNLLKYNENLSFVNGLKGVVRYQNADYQGAKLFTEKAIQGGMDNVPNRIIAGVSAIKLENFEQAFQHFEPIQDSLPSEHPVRKLYAMVALKLGHNIEGSEAISRYNGLTEDDIVFLSAATAQLLREGKRSEALALSEKTDSIEFTDPLRIAQKGMLRLTLKDLDGINDLQKAVAIDPSLQSANAALAQAFLDNNLFTEALNLSSKWIAQKPNDVNGYVLAALAYKGLNKNEEAESMYNKALEQDANNPAANIYLAEQAIESDDKQLGLSHLQKVITAYPTYIKALKLFFTLKHDLGLTNEGLAPIKNVLEEHPTSERLNLLLGQALFKAGQLPEAISALEKIDKSDKLPDDFWILLTNSYSLAGQQQLALNTVSDWMSISPRVKNAYLLAININEQFNNLNEALNISRIAQSKFSDDHQFKVLTIHLNVLTGKVKSANEAFKLLPERISQSSVGNGLHGQILLESGKYSEALPKLQLFYEESPSNRNATFVAKALKNLNRHQDAIAFLQSHLEKSNNRDKVRLQIAELAISARQFDVAREQYLELLKHDGKNIRALNNLANIFVVLNNGLEAEKYAKQASKLIPDNANILDTLARSLMLNSKYKEAAEIAAKAYDLDKESVEMGLHYCQALILSGEIQKAKRVLAKLETSDMKLKQKILELRDQVNG